VRPGDAERYQRRSDVPNQKHAFLGVPAIINPTEIAYDSGSEFVRTERLTGFSHSEASFVATAGVHMAAWAEPESVSASILPRNIPHL